MIIKKAITRRDVLDKALKGSIATTALLMGGGTPFMKYLKKHRNETDAHHLARPTQRADTAS